MFFYITITTKEKATLNSFLAFLSKIKIPTLQFAKLKQNKKKTKVVTTLKSPHINKTAQEQFEFRFFSRQISLISFNPMLGSNIFKYIARKRFSGINIKLVYIFDKKKQSKKLLYFLNPDKVILKKTKFLKNYLKMFDFYGEVYLRNKFD